MPLGQRSVDSYFNDNRMYYSQFYATHTDKGECKRTEINTNIMKVDGRFIYGARNSSIFN